MLVTYPVVESFEVFAGVSIRFLAGLRLGEHFLERLAPRAQDLGLFLLAEGHCKLLSPVEWVGDIHYLSVRQ